MSRILSLNPYERLSLFNQFQMLSQLDPDKSQDYSYKAEILMRGYTGLYNKVFDFLNEEEPRELTEETIGILTMYRYINNAIAALSDEDKKRLRLTNIKYEGFDGNEKHFHAVSLMRSQGLWAELEGQPQDSHSGTTIIKYRKMLEVFTSIDPLPATLSKEHIQLLIDAV